MKTTEYTSIPPQISGKDMRTEKRIALLKVVLALVAIGISVSYYAQPTAHYRTSLFATILLLLLWLISNGAIYLLLKRQRYVSRTAVVSTAIDVLVTLGIETALSMDIALNFINGPIVGLYFLMVSVSAMRKNRLLIYGCGISCAVLYSFKSFVLLTYRGFDLIAEPILIQTNLQIHISLMDPLIISTLLLSFTLLLGHVIQEINRTERYYLGVFDQIPDGVVIISNKYRIVALNRRFASMVDVSPDDLLETDFRQLVATPTYAISDFYKKDPYPVMMRLQSRTKNEIPVEISGVPIAIDDHPCRELSVREISTRVELEKNLARSQKVQTIGKLAGGLAHDFRNLLSGIYGAVSLARRHLKIVGSAHDKETFSPYLATIMECGEAADQLMERLSSLSKSSNVHTVLSDIGHIVASTVEIARHSIPASSSLITIENMEPETPVVASVDKLSITQAVLNLCVNAIDAIGDAGGRIIVRTRIVTDSESASFQLSECSYVCIEVADDGPGISAETIHHIFEPFFTTKSAERGTGIGLFMVQGVAISHGGWVDVKSDIGNGSVFRLFLEQHCHPQGNNSPPEMV